MGRIFEQMKAFFDQDGWKYEELDNQPWLRAPFRGRDGDWWVYAQAREEQEQFVFYSVPSIKVPEERRTEMSAFITRANYGMVIGNFEMDFSDGEVRYKTSVDVEGVDLSFELAKGIVHANFHTVDRYLSGLMAVAFGGMDAATAIAATEG